MSVAYRLLHENGKITEVEQTQRLMVLPRYRKIRDDADGVCVFEAPKEHVRSVPIKIGKGILGRLQERREEAVEREEFLNQLPKNVELKQSFEEWKSARGVDEVSSHNISETGDEPS